MAEAPSKPRLSGLARALVQHGKLAEPEAEHLQKQAHTHGISFVEQLLLNRQMEAYAVAEFASQSLGIPLLDLNAIDMGKLDKSLLDHKLILEKRFLPLHKRGNHLFIGLADPTDIQALDEIRFKTNLLIDPVVVEADKLSAALAKILETVEAPGANLGSREELEHSLQTSLQNEKEGGANTEGDIDVEDAPVVKYIQKLLIDAIETGVSDIHFEPYEKFFRIRYRLDGVLIEVSQPPIALKEKIAARIKIISNLDIAEKRVPQDGRMKLVLSPTRAIDFRVSTLPTLFGEKIVMRILDSASTKLGIDVLGYEPDQKELLLKAINRPYGMILVTGPTGSGKTISLYTCLNILNKPGVNISTAEDPAEINLPGINQVNINDKAGLDFSSSLRAFLRQDPDIIMVGEIRDLETAEIAIKAAQTGHMVMSTLHTNDAPTTLTRLANMGVAAFNIASSVILITAQRLARKLCVHCKQPIEVPREGLLSVGFTEADLDGSWTLYGPVGCPECKNTGYKGRVGIYEVMPISDEMQRIIMKNGTAIDIADQARREGVRNLRTSGLWKVKQGITSLAEVEAVTNA